MSQHPQPGPPGPPPSFRPGQITGWPAPQPPRRPGSGRLVAIVIAVVVVIAAVAAAVVVGVRHDGSGSSMATSLESHSSSSPSLPAPSIPPLPTPAPAVAMPPEAAAAIDLAKRFVAVLNTYGPTDLAHGRLGAYEDRVRPLLTPAFFTEFEKNVQYAATTVKRTGAARTATALGAGIEHVEGREFRVLVAARVVTYDGKKPVTEMSYLEVTAAQQPGGRLLVDQMATAGTTPPAAIPAPTGLAPAADQAVLAAAKAAPVVLGYDYRTLSSWQTRAKPLVTPRFLTELAKSMKVVKDRASATKVVVTVKPLALSVRSLDVDRVDVVAYLERPTTSATTTKPVDYHDGVVMTMVRSDGAWLLDGIKVLSA